MSIDLNGNKNLIIHIGMNKTGSSSIQETLFYNLKDKRYRYLDFGTPNHGGPMKIIFQSDFFDRPHVNRYKFTENEVQEIRKKLIKKIEYQINNADSGTFIISGEEILSLSNFDPEFTDVKKVKSYFSKFFDDIKIVAYVRTPKPFNESLFQQNLKEGVGWHIRPLSTYQPYKRKFEKFDVVFGKENVHLWKFDPITFPKKDVVLDFCEKIGIKVDEKDVVRVNESLSLEAISLLYVYRKYYQIQENGSENIKENQMMIEVFQKIGNKKYKTASSFMKPFFEKNEEDISWIKARMEQDFDDEYCDDKAGITSEDDLESIAKKSVHLLYEFINKKNLPIDVKDVDESTAEDIARIVHGLRLTIKEQYGNSFDGKIHALKEKNKRLVPSFINNIYDFFGKKKN